MDNLESKISNAECEYNVVVILGPTASGKTNLAVRLASKMGGEIISADSRQVYRGMDIGTGKDIHEYNYLGEDIPYHLIDILEAGERYNLSYFVDDVNQLVPKIIERGNLPIICGGTGLYIHTLLQKQNYIHIPVNLELRSILEDKEKEDLLMIFTQLPNSLFPKADISTRKRLIRAIEIINYLMQVSTGIDIKNEINLKAKVFGLCPELEIRRNLISKRLNNRLNTGLIEEVEGLIKEGVTPEKLINYGLEYKYVTLYLMGTYSYAEMVNKLETEIHRYAKRQMTFFRKMEKDGVKIDWIDNQLKIEDAIEYLTNRILDNGNY